MFSSVIALGEYDDQLRKAVLQMKTDRDGALIREMSTLLYRTRQKELQALKPDLIVPVPMHFWRRLVRGTNAPDKIASRLGELLRIPCHSHCISRIRQTHPQSQLDPKERFKNVQGAFAFRKKAGQWLFGFDPKLHLYNKRVLLVDDILTTGSTGSEVARLLFQQGACLVTLAVLARTKSLSDATVLQG